MDQAWLLSGRRRKVPLRGVVVELVAAGAQLDVVARIGRVHAVNSIPFRSSASYQGRARMQDRTTFLTRPPLQCRARAVMGTLVAHRGAREPMMVTNCHLPCLFARDLADVLGRAHPAAIRPIRPPTGS